MKSRFLSIFILSFIIALSCGNNSGNTGKTEVQTQISQSSQNQAVSGNKKYQIKSGIVTFETSISNIKGKEILYFDDFGTKELLEKYSGDKLKEATLGDGTTMYTIKFDQKTAYRMGNAERGVAYKFDWNEISEKEQETKAKKLSNMNIAGKDCESYSYESSGTATVFAGWNNICLYKEQKMKFGTSVTKAVSIEENAVISPDKFKVPEGFVVK